MELTARSCHPNVAAIFGVTGIVGKELARLLVLSPDWKVYGVARRRAQNHELCPTRKYHFVSCDLLDPLETLEKVYPLVDVTHVFWVTWASQFPLDSPECCEQNRAMMANAFNALLPNTRSLRHVSIQTGMKHYVSLQGSLSKEVVYYDEQSPRVDKGHNFYYALEDLLQERLPRHHIAWSIHRPGLVMGCSQITLYNLIGSICVYGTICKYLNLPFVFGGSKECWEEMYIDTCDARLAAEQQVWVANKHERVAHGQAFNVIDGQCYTWKMIWPAIGAKLGLNAPENGSFSGEFMFSSAMGDKDGVWKEIVAKGGLVETEMKDLANWDFLDVLFRFPIKLLGSRKKIDSMGFKTRYHTIESISYWIDVMKKDNIIP